MWTPPLNGTAVCLFLRRGRRAPGVHRACADVSLCPLQVRVSPRVGAGRPGPRCSQVKGVADVSTTLVASLSTSNRFSVDCFSFSRLASNDDFITFFKYLNFLLFKNPHCVDWRSQHCPTLALSTGVLSWPRGRCCQPFTAGRSAGLGLGLHVLGQVNFPLFLGY